MWREREKEVNKRTSELVSDRLSHDSKISASNEECAQKRIKTRENGEKKDHVITLCGMTLWHLLNTRATKETTHSTMFCVVNLFGCCCCCSCCCCFLLSIFESMMIIVDNKNLMKYKIDNKEKLEESLFSLAANNVNMNLFLRRVEIDLSVAVYKIYRCPKNT